MAKIDLRVVDKLLPIINLDRRIKIVVGGRGSGKSIGVGDVQLGKCDMGQRICCSREFQNSIDDSVHQHLKEAIVRLGAEGMSVTDNQIRSSSGGNIFYKGLARNITSIKSISGVNTLWVEEAESVSEKSLRVVTPSVRSSASGSNEAPPEIWMTMNRRSRKDAVAKKYLKRAEYSLKKNGIYHDELMVIIEINWRDNPWFPQELELERLDDLQNLDEAMYNHIWEGHYGDQVENAIIEADWFDACVDAHEKLGFEPQGQELVSYDPADTGDAKALTHLHGSVVLDVQKTHQGRIDDATDWACSYTNNKKVDAFTWDCDGMGIGLLRQVNDSFRNRNITVEAFRGSEGVDNPDQEYYPEGMRTVSDIDQIKTVRDYFVNKRAQYYFTLRDRMFRTWQAVKKQKYSDPTQLLSISSTIDEIEDLRSEVCSIPRKFVGSGKIYLLTKQEMKKIDIDSPNMADSLMMSMREIQVSRPQVSLSYDSTGIV